MAGSRLQSWGHRVPVNLGRIGCEHVTPCSLCEVMGIQRARRSVGRHSIRVRLFVGPARTWKKPEVAWARMSFKPQRSRSRPRGKQSFWLGDARIQSVSQKPVDSLGRIFFFYQQSREQSSATGNQPMTSGLGVQLGAGSGLPAEFKAWKYWDKILLLLLWPLLVYEVPVTTVESFENKDESLRVQQRSPSWVAIPYWLPFSSLVGGVPGIQSQRVQVYCVLCYLDLHQGLYCGSWGQERKAFNQAGERLRVTSRWV